MSVFNIFRRKDYALPQESGEANLQKPNTKLDAKLHQGYEPDSEYKERGNLFSSVQFSKDTIEHLNTSEDQLVGTGLFDKLAKAISDIFGNQPEIQSLQPSQVSENDTNIFNSSQIVSGFSGLSASQQENIQGGSVEAMSIPPAPVSAGEESPSPAPGIGSYSRASSSSSAMSMRSGGDSSSISSIEEEDASVKVHIDPVNGAVEDAAIPLSIQVENAADTNDVSVLISGLPAGAVLSAGANQGGGVWLLTYADLQNLTLTPPPSWGGDVTLTVEVRYNHDGVLTTDTATLPFHVTGQADAPILSVQNATGLEGVSVLLNISATLSDTDGSETLTIKISNVPAGGTLSAGTNLGNGVWSLTPAELTNLSFLPPAGFSGSLNLLVEATSHEEGTSSTVAHTLTVGIDGVASVPNLSVQNSLGNEDQAVILHIQAASNDPDSETIAIIVSDVPAGAMLSAGVNNGNGSWTLTPAQLTGLTLLPPLNFSGQIALTVTAVASENGTQSQTQSSVVIGVAGIADTPVLTVQNAVGSEDVSIALNIIAALTDTDGSETLVITIENVPADCTLSAGINLGNGIWSFTPAELSGLTFQPPAGFSGQLNLVVKATSSEAGTSSTVSHTLTVNIDGVASAPNLNTQNSSGNEDHTIALNIQASSSDPDSETVSIVVSGVPAGAGLSAGVDNGNGSWTLTPLQLPGLMLTPPANFSGQISLTVTAIASENSTQSQVQSTVLIAVSGVADAPNLTAAPAAAFEDAPVALNISASLVDTDGSETMLITVGGVPAGATLSAGTNNGNGTWTLTPGQLSGLTLTPPLHYSGALNLSISATASENGTSATTTLPPLTVNVQGVATLPNVWAQNAIGEENVPIELNLVASLTDTDGSETLALVLAGIPTGFTLSAGTDNGNGTWTLTPAQLSGLTLTAPAGYSGSLQLSLQATATEGADSITNSTSFNVVVTSIAHTPVVSVSPITATEDTPIALNIILAPHNPAETVTIVIGNIPAGVMLSAGVDNGNGTWSLTPAQLSGLTLTTPPNWSGVLNLSVEATASLNGTTATSANALPLTISGSADAPTLSVSGVTGNEDTAIALNINAALVDTDGSEILTVTINNVPAGAMLSAGINNGGGVWTLTAAEVSGLTLTPPLHYSGTINLGIIAMSSENGTTAATSASLPVTVAGVASPPVVNAGNVTGIEDTSIPLSISAALTDTDGSENLSIVVINIPAGASLSAGTDNGDGTWSVLPSQLPGLNLIPPLHYSGSMNLSVTAISSENGTTATSTTSFNLTVEGVATPPNLSVGNATGAEDSPISLAISSSLADPDSETLSIVVGGVPSGAILSAGLNNGNGTWTLTPAQLSGLSLTPPANFSGQITLSVTAISSENGTTAQVSQSLNINVTGVADTPLLTVQAATGAEGGAIALSISAVLTDADGSETLSVTIANIPAGSILSAGTDNGNGTWTLTVAQLSGLTLTPPPNYHGVLNLSVIATASENGTTAQTSARSLPVTVGSVADAPSLLVQAASGSEDTAITLNISAILTDSSETLSIVIGGVPAGAILSAGTNNGNGTWTLTSAQLSGLTLTPPLNWSGSLPLTVTAISSDGSTTAQTSAALPVTVTGVADAPSLTVQPVAGNEDTAIPLTIAAALTDADGSETLTMTISGVPAGAILSAGTSNGNGTWTLTPAQLTGLTLTPPLNMSGTINLTVNAVSSEGASTAQTTANLTMTVNGVADTPTLSVQAASGAEHSAIPLVISAALTDTDGSETLNVIVGNVPAGATLSSGTNNGNGTWTLTSAQLSGLTITPPLFQSGTLNLSVIAVAAENGTSAQTSAITLPVHISGIADAPTLSVQAAAGLEDTSIALNITAALTDIDGSENLSITISGVPAGATLSAGVDNGNGSWTLAPADLSGLTLTPPAHWSGTINLHVSAVSTEGASTNHADATLSVTVTGVADQPILNVLPATGLEDTAILLPLTAVLADADGSETLSVTISGVPAGATLSAGTNNGNGSWTLTSAQLAGLSLTPPANWSGSFNLSLTATAAEGSSSAQVSTSMAVTVSGVADVPNVTVQAAAGSEGNSIALNITASLTDTDGSETLSILIGNIPAGAVLSAGVNNHNGTWTLASADLTGLTITPPPYTSGVFNLTVTAIASENGTTASTVPVSLPLTVSGTADMPVLSVLPAIGAEDTQVSLAITAALTDITETLTLSVSGVPAGMTLSAGTNLGNGVWNLTPAQLAGLTLNPSANYSGSFALIVTATSSDGTTTAHLDQTLNVTITPVADTPTLSVQAVSGYENAQISLNITAGVIDSSETLEVVIGGIPAGAVLSNGTNNGNGTWTLTSGQLAGLKLTPPPYWSGDLPLTVTATSHDGPSSASVSSGLNVHVEGVATPPLLSAPPVFGVEDSPIALNITAALQDTDGSETLTVTIGNMPNGSSLSAGTNNGDGTWTLTPAQLPGLIFTPPPHASGLITLGVYSTSSENGTTAHTNTLMTVNLTGVATTPHLSVSSATGQEDMPVVLDISAALADTDGSETLNIIISNVPAGATLSAGANTGSGIWSLTSAQLTGLTLTPPANWSGSISLNVTAVSTEGASTATTQLTLPVTLAGVADAPALSVHSVTGQEDTSIALGITAALTDTDGSETLTVTIAGVPAGAALSAGTYAGGVWTLTPAQFTGLTLTPAANWSGSFNLVVTATATEGVSTAVTVGNIPVTIGGVADAPVLNVTAAFGSEDTAVPLVITAGLTDTDGSETLAITIGNVPAGALLSAGVNNGNGTWTLTAAQLTNLTFTPPLNASGVFNLSVTATSAENGTTANTSLILPVAVAGVADGAHLNVGPVAGTENLPVALNISAALADTDGSETLSITISGLPAGASLSAGFNAGNGTWVLTPAQLSGLTLIPSSNYNGAFALTVVALTSENGTTASVSASLPVTIAGLASTPVLAVTAAAGLEDNAIPLTISSNLTDSSEVLSIVISNVPAGASLSRGLYAGNGKWSLSPSDLAGLTITPPANYSGTINLTVTAVSTETNGDHSSLSASLSVTVAPVVDAPVLSVAPASGNEDTAIALNISAALKDTDGSEVMSIQISGVPLTAALSAGTNIGGGIWSLTPAQLNNLKITPPANSDADFVLNIAVTSTESNGTTSTVNAALSVTVNAIADVPVAPTVSVSGTGNQLNVAIAGALADNDGSETITYLVRGVPDGFAFNKGLNNGDNTWTLKPSDLAGLKLTGPEQFNGQLNLSVVSVSHDTGGSVAVSAASSFNARYGNYASGYLVDLDVGVNVGGIGAGVHVGALPDIDLLPATGGVVGTKVIYAKEDTAFLIADAPQLLANNLVSALLGLLSRIEFSGVPSGVTFSAGTNKGGGVWWFTQAQLNNLYMTPPPNGSTDFTILITAKMLSIADIGLYSVPVHVMAVADMPTLTATAGVATEDSSFALNIAGALTDVDGSESLTFLVSGMPAGFQLNHGINNGNGTWSVQSSDLPGLTVIPKEHYSGTVNLIVSAIATEAEGDQTVRQQNVSVNVTAIADAPVIAALPVTINEDQPVTLNLGISLRDTDGSEQISSVTISGLPAGASLTHAVNTAGVWSVDLAHLNDVQLVPPANWNGDMNLNITAVSRETSTGLTATTTSSLAVHVNAVADAPVTTATDSTGQMETPISLHLGAALTDTDGSESLTAVISGIPDHATLSHGLNNGDGTWTVAASDLSTLTLTPPENFVGDIAMSLTAYSREGNASTASSHQDFTVHVTAPPMAMMMAFSMMDNDPLANQSGWVDADNSGAGADAGMQSADFFNDMSSNVSNTNDHDLAFQNHGTG